MNSGDEAVRLGSRFWIVCKMAGQLKRIPSSDSITVDTKCGTVGNIPLPGLSAPDVA